MRQRPTMRSRVPDKVWGQDLALAPVLRAEVVSAFIPTVWLSRLLELHLHLGLQPRDPLRRAGHRGLREWRLRADRTLPCRAWFKARLHVELGNLTKIQPPAS